MTRDEKIIFYDKIEKALRIEHPVIVEGLTKTEIIELIKINSPLLNRIVFNDLDTFKSKVWDLENIEDGTTLLIGSSAYTLDSKCEDTVDNIRVINHPDGGRWVYNEGLIDYVSFGEDLVVGDDLTIDDAEEAWNNI